jgi:predicted ABC-type ATPase
VGGNGAGKSTFQRLYLEQLGLPFVNADNLARIVYPRAPDLHSYEAARLAVAQQRQRLL